MSQKRETVDYFDAKLKENGDRVTLLFCENSTYNYSCDFAIENEREIGN